MQQDRLIGAAGPRHYRAVRGWASRPEYGNAILVEGSLAAGEGSTLDEDRVDLGFGREAHRVVVGLPGGSSVTFAVTHLHHPTDGEIERDGQTAGLLDWLAAGRSTDALIVVGDFNAPPAEPAYARMRAAGFTSASLAANGAEPDVTWPSGLDAPAKDTDGDPSCLDYIWVRGAARVADCRLAWDRPAVGDPTLYPSDHVGLLATIEVGA
jgi:endonuclease/exonuclease/phosphatase family metal-dependent hydrolase